MLLSNGFDKFQLISNVVLGDVISWRQGRQLVFFQTRGNHCITSYHKNRLNNGVRSVVKDGRRKIHRNRSLYGLQTAQGPLKPKQLATTRNRLRWISGCSHIGDKKLLAFPAATRIWYYVLQSPSHQLHTEIRIQSSTLCSFSFIYRAGVEPSPLLLRPIIGLLYQLWMMDGADCGASGMNEWQGKPKYSALSTTDSTGIDPDSNPGRCGGAPATRVLYKPSSESFILHVLLF
jgi:hypothetical protein